MYNKEIIYMFFKTIIKTVKTWIYQEFTIHISLHNAYYGNRTNTNKLHIIV